MKRDKIDVVGILEDKYCGISNLKEFAGMILELCFVDDYNKIEELQMRKKYAIAQKANNILFDLMHNETEELGKYIDEMYKEVNGND